MRKPNSINELNNLIKNKENLLKYNSILRLYWSSLLKKKITNQHLNFLLKIKNYIHFLIYIILI